MKEIEIGYTVEDFVNKIGKKAARGFFITMLEDPYDTNAKLYTTKWWFEHTFDSDDWRRYNHSFGYERTSEQWDAGLHPSKFGGAQCCRCAIEKGLDVTHAPGRANDPFPYVEIDENLLP